MRYPTNKYPGTCVDCGATVAAGAGRTWKGRGGWKVSHGGTCTGRAATPRVVTFRLNSGAEVYRNANGICEDAPCCGCCSP